MNDDECIREIVSGGAGRDKAIAQLFERYYRKFVSYLTFRRVARSDAEDLVQDVFVNVVNSLPESKSDIRSARAYLYRALHNRFVDHIRAKRPEIREAELSGRNDDDDNAILERIAEKLGLNDEDDHGFLACFQHALQQFFENDEDSGTAIQMAVEGFSGEEMAAVLGRTHGATREFLRQCRRKFQGTLRELCLDYLPERLRSAT